MISASARNFLLPQCVLGSSQLALVFQGSKLKNEGTLLSALEKKHQAPADFGVSASIHTASEKLHTLKYRGTTFCKPQQHSTSQYRGSPTPSIPAHFPAEQNNTKKSHLSLSNLTWVWSKKGTGGAET